MIDSADLKVRAVWNASRRMMLVQIEIVGETFIEAMSRSAWDQMLSHAAEYKSIILNGHYIESRISGENREQVRDAIIDELLKADQELKAKE